jgi:hypothetical protein
VSHASKSVRITKEGHEHADKPSKIGDVIHDLTEAEAHMLITAGVAEATAGKAKAGSEK